MEEHKLILEGHRFKTAHGEYDKMKTLTSVTSGSTTEFESKIAVPEQNSSIVIED